MFCCNVSHFQDSILNAIPVGLQQLVLSGNQLIELPRRLMRFRNLVALDVSNNKLEHVHEDVSFWVGLLKQIVFRFVCCAIFNF
jgi:hypothetical protein